MNNIKKLVNNVQIFKDHYLNDKWSTVKIGKFYNIAPTTISKILRENGISISKKIGTGRKRVYNVDHDYFNIINTQEKAYILGFLYADGYITNNNKVGITLKLEDKEILNIIKKELKSEYPLTYHEASYNENYKKTKKVRFSITSSIMFNKLKHIGCTENKSNSLKFPSLDIIPNHLIVHFIRGYFDGDGSIYKRITTHKGKQYDNIGFSFIGTKEFIESVVSNLPFCYNGRLYKEKRTFKNVWEFKTGGLKRSQIFYNWLYNDATIYLNRKKLKFEQLLNLDVQRL